MSSQKPALKKVLFLITKSNWGGAQRYVYDLATTLDTKVYEPVVALGGNGTLVEMLHHAGVRTITINSLERDIDAKKELALARELYQIFRDERPDIVHLNSSKAGAMGALIGRLARVPRIIFTAHGWAFNEDRPHWQRVVIKCIHAATVLLSHHTIAVSTGMASELDWPVVRDKMTVINPGRSIGAMFTKTEARGKIADFFPQTLPYLADPWLVCVAELHPIKRHTVLFEAVRTITATNPTVRLLCFGDGQLRQSLETWVTTHGMSENIFVLGSLHEAARFLKAFDGFVLASKSESYGYVLHEAGLAGVPVIATNVGGIPDIITHEKTGVLVSPHNASGLASALNTLFAAPGQATAMADALKEQLLARSVDTMTTETIALYRRVSLEA
jgi:glycosyltransferase involved in cell wall biosynthesis